MTTRHLVRAFVIVLLASSGARSMPAKLPQGMKRIEAGSFHPVYARPGEQVSVSSFALDTVAVSERAFTGNPSASLRIAMTDVTAAQAGAYCKARGARLPTTNEWEYVARASKMNRDGAN